MRLIEIRRGITGPRRLRIVTSEEQSQTALIVKSMRPGVASRELQATRKPLTNLKLQSVIVRNAFGCVHDGIHVIPDIGHAYRSIAGVLIRRDGFEIEGKRGGAAVGVDLAIHRMLRSGDECLVERNRQDLMRTVVADITRAEQPTVRRLILEIEGPVRRVGEFIVDVIAAEQERAEQVTRRPVARDGLRQVRQQGLECGRAACGRGYRGGSEWVLENRALCRHHGRNEWWRQGHTERPVVTRTCAG